MPESVWFLLIGTFGPGFVIAVIIFLNPDKVQQWGSFIAYSISKLGGYFRVFHKTAVRLDLQGYINEYVKNISKDLPFLESQKIKIEFVDETISRKGIMEDGTVILRLRSDEKDELNFVHASYLFVSTSLLFRVKRYISQSQRDALDLYVTTQLIEKEKPSTIDYFLENYLHPNLKDSKSERAANYNNLAIIDDGGLFNAVLLEELQYLGSKVFGNNKDDRIISEVRGLIDFLVRVSQRVVGQNDTDLNYKREFCRSAILIVGKFTTILTFDEAPYVGYIRDVLYKKNEIEMIYILGAVEKTEIVNEVCDQVKDMYNKIRSRTIRRRLNHIDGTIRYVNTYAVVLRRVGAAIYQKS